MNPNNSNKELLDLNKSIEFLKSLKPKDKIESESAQFWINFNSKNSKLSLKNQTNLKLKDYESRIKMLETNMTKSLKENIQLLKQNELLKSSMSQYSHQNLDSISNKILSQASFIIEFCKYCKPHLFEDIDSTDVLKLQNIQAVQVCVERLVQVLEYTEKNERKISEDWKIVLISQKERHKQVAANSVK